ncbi:MAG TPA: hypothetical protein VFH45_10375 [Acidimicrobiales bacterium]|nr:hypothetical protein [Acidimicrobiales bacterium]
MAGRRSGARSIDVGGGSEQSDGVEANARLTSSTALVLFVLLAVEGATVLQVRSLLSVHVFVGVLLVPPVLLKIASTGYRFARYYLGAPGYRRKGPPPWLLRLLGPAVVVLTVVLFGSGVALMYAGSAAHTVLLTAHKASFVLWFLAMTVHVLGHLPETFREGFADWVGRAGRPVTGSGARRAALVLSLAVGAVAAAAVLGRVGPYLAGHLGGPG